MNLWVVLAGTALLIGAVVAVGVSYALTLVAPATNLTVIGFALGLAVWGTLLWRAFRAVGFGNAGARAVVFVVIGVIAFGIELFASAFIVITAWPVYLLGAAAVIALAVWQAWTRRLSTASRRTGSFWFNDDMPPDDT